MPSRDQRLRTPARALLVIKQPVLAEIVKLALNHGQYSARVAQTAAEASVALAEWRPHLAILDMDIAESAVLDRLRPTEQAHQLPVIALTRRGDLKAKLAAFERGVDDILNRHVRAGETELHLTPLEQSLLYLLAANAGHLLTRDEILDYLWGADYVAESNVVDRHIRNLRAKLQTHSGRRYIATVPGRGYRFVAPVS